MTESVERDVDCCGCEECDCGCQRSTAGEVEIADVFERRVLRTPDKTR